MNHSHINTKYGNFKFYCRDSTTDYDLVKSVIRIGANNGE